MFAPQKTSFLHTSNLFLHHNADRSPGYGPITKGAGAMDGNGQKGGVVPPAEPSAAPDTDIVPQQATTEAALLVVPDPTSGILVMVTRERHHELPSPVPQGKSYKYPELEATVEPEPVVPQSKEPQPAVTAAVEPTPAEPAVTLGPAPVVTEANPGLLEAEEVPQGKYYSPGAVVFFS